MTADAMANNTGCWLQIEVALAVKQKRQDVANHQPFGEGQG